MKTTRYERITTKPVTVQREVREVADIPTIDFREVIVEVTDERRGEVYVNGCLWAGVRFKSYDETLPHSFYREVKCKASFFTMLGDITMDVTRLIFTDNKVPQSVEWKEKEVSRDVAICCFPCCDATLATLRSDGSYRCDKHHRHLHPYLR